MPTPTLRPSKEPPPLPPGMDGFTVTDRTKERVVVALADAAKLVGLSLGTLEIWIRSGRVEITYSPTMERMVFVDSLWLALPEDQRLP